MNQKVKEVFEKKVKPLIKRDNLVLMILAGVLLLIISLPMGKKEERSEKKGVGYDQEQANVTGMLTEDVDESDDEDKAEVYRRKLEEELENFLAQMEGAGEVRVMVVLKESEEMVVEKDLKKVQRQTGESGGMSEERVASESTIEEDTVQGGEKTPFVVKRICPKIEGVVVLAKGVGTGHVRSDIAQAVQALLGIEAHKIKVLKLGHIKSTK